MAINSYQREIYKSHLEHGLKGQRAAHHKYLYIDENGRYVYPEDVAGKAKSTASNIGSMATAAGTAAKTKISNVIADQKTKLKDKKYLLDEKRRKYPNLEKANVTSPGGKRVNQITSAHQEGTKKTTALSYQSTHDPISNKVVKVKRDFDANGDQIGVGYSTESSHIGKKKEYNEKSKDAGFQAEMERRQATIDARNAKPRKGSDFSNLVKAEDETAKRKAEKEKAKSNIDQQRKSAHVGYEGRIKKRNAVLRARSQEIGADIEGKKRREEKLRKEDVYENANYKYDDWYDGGNYVPISGHHTKITVGSTGERLPFNAPGMLKAISNTNRRKDRKKKVKDQIRSAHRSAR